MVDIDRDRAAALGVDARQIEHVLAAAFGSRKVSTIYTSSSQYAVILEIDAGIPAGMPPPRSRSTCAAADGQADLAASAGHSRDGEVAPLQVNHQGQLPAVTISFNLAPDVSLGTAIDQMRALERRLGTAAYDFDVASAAPPQAFEASMQGMGVLLFLAILVVYIVLGILYESFIHPLTILSGSAGSGLGALIALHVAGLPLTLYAFVGIIMLVGIVKKNAIMMIDFALEAQREDGKSPEQAHLRSLPACGSGRS